MKFFTLRLLALAMVVLGHDNMFVSSYPIQMQSILRPWFAEHGAEGAAFRSSHHGIGGAIGTKNIAPCVHGMFIFSSFYQIQVS